MEVENYNDISNDNLNKKRPSQHNELDIPNKIYKQQESFSSLKTANTFSMGINKVINKSKPSEIVTKKKQGVGRDDKKQTTIASFFKKK